MIAQKARVGVPAIASALATDSESDNEAMASDNEAMESDNESTVVVVVDSDNEPMESDDEGLDAALAESVAARRDAVDRSEPAYRPGDFQRMVAAMSPRGQAAITYIQDAAIAAAAKRQQDAERKLRTAEAIAAAAKRQQDAERKPRGRGRGGVPWRQDQQGGWADNSQARKLVKTNGSAWSSV